VYDHLGSSKSRLTWTMSSLKTGSLTRIHRAQMILRHAVAMHHAARRARVIRPLRGGRRCERYCSMKPAQTSARRRADAVQLAFSTRRHGRGLGFARPASKVRGDRIARSRSSSGCGSIPCISCRRPAMCWALALGSTLLPRRQTGHLHGRPQCLGEACREHWGLICWRASAEKSWGVVEEP
jgi:hypothetical protein